MNYTVRTDFIDYATKELNSVRLKKDNEKNVVIFSDFNEGVIFNYFCCDSTLNGMLRALDFLEIPCKLSDNGYEIDKNMTYTITPETETAIVNFFKMERDEVSRNIDKIDSLQRDERTNIELVALGKYFYVFGMIKLFNQLGLDVHIPSVETDAFTVVSPEHNNVALNTFEKQIELLKKNIIDYHLEKNNLDLLEKRLSISSERKAKMLNLVKQIIADSFSDTIIMKINEDSASTRTESANCTKKLYLLSETNKELDGKIKTFFVGK